MLMRPAGASATIRLFYTMPEDLNAIAKPPTQICYLKHILDTSLENSELEKLEHCRIMDAEEKKCASCRATKTVNADHFKKIRDGYAAVCKQCSEKRSRKRREDNLIKKKAAADDESESDDDDSNSDDEMDEELRAELGNLELEDFIRAVLDTEDVKSFAARVEMSWEGGSGGPEMRRERADNLARKIWEDLEYRFVYGFKYIFCLFAR